MTHTLPSIPEVPEAQRAHGTYPIRFEDLAQDGRVHLEPIVASIDASIWRPMLGRSAVAKALRAEGVRPIFTRLALEVGPARLEPGATLDAEGVYQLAHEPDGQGGAVRLFLNMWTTIWSEPSRRAPRGFAGRLFAEHQLTRPHAPPGERRVVALPGGEVPEAEYRSPAHEALLEIEPGAAWLEPSFRPDAAPIRFGLDHTDVNQHVNSLVYPRVFADAALRRLAELGEDTRGLTSWVHIAFRKPFFAGDAARIDARAYRAPLGPGAAGAFRAAEAEAGAEPSTKPNVTMQLGFS